MATSFDSFFVWVLKAGSAKGFSDAQDIAKAIGYTRTATLKQACGKGAVNGPTMATIEKLATVLGRPVSEVAAAWAGETSAVASTGFVHPLAQRVSKIVDSVGAKRVAVFVDAMEALAGRSLHEHPRQDTIRLLPPVRRRREPLLAYIEDVAELPEERTRRVTRIGRVAAGRPMFAPENQDGEATIPVEWDGPEPSYVVRVHGDSMQDRLFDGDDAFVVCVPEVGPGEIVVVHWGDDAQVKRLRYLDGAFWLCSDNPDQERYPPRLYEPENCHIQGVVIGTLRPRRRP